MQGNYISIADFEVYKANEATDALSVLDMNLRNENKLNQAAARMLGFSSYEALEPMHRHERLIRDSVAFEPACPYQGGRPVFRHKNILVVCDFQSNRILARALTPGEERGYLHMHKATGDSGITLRLPSDLSVNGDPNVNIGYAHASLKYGAVAAYESNVPGRSVHISVAIDGLGVEIAIKTREAGSGQKAPETIDSAHLSLHAGVRPSVACKVNQAALRFERNAPCGDGVVYRWLRSVIDDFGTPRLLKFGNEWGDERVAPTDLLFHSVEEAMAFRESNDLDYSEDDFEGLVLCMETKTPV